MTYCITVNIFCNFQAKSLQTSGIKDDPFDDGMDDLLSQIEEPVYTAIQSKTNATTSNINRPLETIVSKEVPSPNGNSFKRFKSENDMKLAGMSTPKPQTTLKSDSSNDRGWKRNYSSPDARMPGLPGGRPSPKVPVKPKCTKEEIERKKQEAIQRRQMKMKLRK